MVALGIILYLVGATIFSIHTGWTYADECLFNGTVIVLAVLSFNFLISRFSYFTRIIRELIDRPDVAIVCGDSDTIAMLVPSYKEDPKVIWQTLFTAALVEHRNRHVTLLIDDPPRPSDAADRMALNEARRIPVSLQKKFDRAAWPFQRELQLFLQRRGDRTVCLQEEAARLARFYKQAAAWLTSEKDDYRRKHGPSLSNTDVFFVQNILERPRQAHLARAAHVREAALTVDDVEDEYRRLAAAFSVKITSFERKQYVNLPHAPSKAMNLNAYLGILGKSLRSVDGADGLSLLPCQPDEADLIAPAADYVIVLDADSFIFSDYVQRLLPILQDPRNANVALVQTPYCAVPGASNLIEHVAGATTDLYFPIHQGLSANNAAFWVGPNSLIRREALMSIAVQEEERGHPYTLFVRDRTVIEDTDTTIALLEKGWILKSYMDRLCYSATPPDFNALVVQRERWANGGLLLIPQLVQYLWASPLSAKKLTEAFLRISNLASPAISSVCMLVLIFFPFDDQLVPVWLPLAAIPFYLMLFCDLKYSGYGLKDLPKVYALNLMLLPVMLGGTALSLMQALTGVKARFKRTPRSSATIAAPRGYVISILLIFYFATYWAASGLMHGDVAHTIISVTVAWAYWYGLHHLMEFRPRLAHVPARWRTYGNFRFAASGGVAAILLALSVQSGIATHTIESVSTLAPVETIEPKTSPPSDFLEEAEPQFDHSKLGLDQAAPIESISAIGAFAPEMDPPRRRSAPWLTADHAREMALRPVRN